jgi:hypothetical protein
MKKHKDQLCTMLITKTCDKCGKEGSSTKIEHVLHSKTIVRWMEYCRRSKHKLCACGGYVTRSLNIEEE